MLENIFPNPARNSISVKCSDCQLSTIRIYDALGRPIQENVVSDPDETITQIQINELPIGVYFLSAYTFNQEIQFTKKFIKY